MIPASARAAIESLSQGLWSGHDATRWSARIGSPHWLYVFLHAAQISLEGILSPESRGATVENSGSKERCPEQSAEDFRGQLLLVPPPASVACPDRHAWGDRLCPRRKCKSRLRSWLWVVLASMPSDGLGHKGARRDDVHSSRTGPATGPRALLRGLPTLTAVRLGVSRAVSEERLPC
jgi:hypothetical protein